MSAPRRWRIMTVCTANQCRSPMAQLMLARALGPDAPVQVYSAGTRTSDGHPVTDLTAEQLLARGLDPSGFASSAITEALIERADLVLTATREHRSVVLEQLPLALRRTFTLLEFAHVAPQVVAAAADGSGPAVADLLDLVRRSAAVRGTAEVPEYDIADPVGGPAEGYPYAAGVIEAATERIAAALRSVLP